MKKRSKQSKAQKRGFGKSADRTHKFNVKGRPMRGGIRL